MISGKISKFKNWYEQNERRISTLSLVGGFTFDALTLQRIDSLLDNVWLGVNLASVCLCILLSNREENLAQGDDGSKHFWFLNILQFNFGALLGGFFIFYFRSAALAVSWPFLLILLVAILANEFLKKHYERLVFQISFLYLSVFVFSIFLIPIILNKISSLIFILSGITSLLVLVLFIYILAKFSKERFKKSRYPIMASVTGIFVFINILYFTNIIPPIPLALKDAGIYQLVTRTDSGSYMVTSEKRGFIESLKFSPKITWVPGNSLYAYSSVFSPADFSVNIFHEWQYKDNSTGKWVTATRIPLHLSGGRTGGFRTYSFKSSLSPGYWRVNVITSRGAVIGRISFRIVQSDFLPPLTTSLKD